MGMRKCDYCIDIGRRIKDTREERRHDPGRTRPQLGVPFQMVQRWERGEQLTIERIVAIALTLKLDPTWLITGQFGVPPQLCRALSDTSVRLERAKSASELLDLFKRRDELRDISSIRCSAYSHCHGRLGDLLRGLLPAITPASQS